MNVNLWNDMFRTELCILLGDEKIKEQQQAGVTITPQMAYEQVSIDTS
jgi:hypothetical protein